MLTPSRPWLALLLTWRFEAYSQARPYVEAHGGTAMVIDYRLLGPLEVGIEGHAVDIGGRKQRELLTILLLSANEPVSRDVFIDRLWGECPPAGAQHTLEVYISRLRKTFGAGRRWSGRGDQARLIPAADSRRAHRHDAF
jgi:DNA-binding SARP family transcriptional activator